MKKKRRFFIPKRVARPGMFYNNITTKNKKQSAAVYLISCLRALTIQSKNKTKKERRKKFALFSLSLYICRD